MPIQSLQNARVANGTLERISDSQWVTGEGISLGNYAFVEIGGDVIRRLIVPQELDNLLTESVGKNVEIFLTYKNELVGIVTESGSVYSHLPTKGADAAWMILIFFYLPILVILSIGFFGDAKKIEGAFVIASIAGFFGLFVFGPVIGRGLVNGPHKGRCERAHAVLKRNHKQVNLI